MKEPGVKAWLFCYKTQMIIPLLLSFAFAAAPTDIHMNSGTLTTAESPDNLPSFLVCNDSVTTNSCFSVSLGGTEVFHITSGGGVLASSVTLTGALHLATMLASAAPVPCTEGDMIYLSNVRKPGEAAGQGSGAPCVCTHAGKAGPLVWQSLYGYVAP